MGFRKTCGFVNCAVESCQLWGSQLGMFTRKSKHSRGCCRRTIEHSNFREDVRDVRSNMASCRADVADVRRNMPNFREENPIVDRTCTFVARSLPIFDATYAFVSVKLPML